MVMEKNNHFSWNQRRKCIDSSKYFHGRVFSKCIKEVIGGFSIEK